METFAGGNRSHRRAVLRLSITAVVLVAMLGVFFVSRSFASTYQVPDTIASDCSVDVTAALMSWIASVPDNSVVSFASGGCYRIEGTLQVSTRIGLAFVGNGSTFRSFNPPSDQRAIWRFVDSAGISLTNMILVGPYSGPFDSSLQHAHGIDLRGTSADIGSISMSHLAGDCVYFGLGFTSALTKSSGNLHDSSCTDTSRNAVSFTAAQNVVVSHLTTDRIGYDVYDVEPNVGAGWGASGITVKDNTIKGYALVAFSIVENAPISNVIFSGNAFVGKGLKAAAGNPNATSFRPSSVTITANTSDTAQAPAAMNLTSIDTLTVTNNTVPMTGGTMVQVDHSCGVNVSGNFYAVATVESQISPYTCTTTTTTTTTTAATTATDSSSPAASPSPTASSSPTATATPMASSTPTATATPTASSTPTATITAPSDGSSVSGRPVKIAASGSAGVIKIEIYIDGILLARSNTGSISVNWNLRQVAGGSHTISARVYDANNQVGSASITVFKSS